MSDETMPAAEAAAVAETDERFSYELAFHVLPTVAEGEVVGVFDAVKALITKTGAEIFDEEAPEKFDLAYEIEKHIDGRNRKYASAYFGWVRFKTETANIEAISDGVEEDANILRYILIRLTRVEEENPFRFHEALASQKMVTTVEESSVVPDFTTVSEEKTEDDSPKEEKEGEESVEVSESELDEALKKDETA